MFISLLPKTSKIVLFQNFQVFTRCHFQKVPIRVPFSKSTVFKICRQKMCRFRVNRRPIRRIFHRFQNVPASCERSLKGILPHNALSHNFLINCNNLSHDFYQKRTPYRIFSTIKRHPVKSSMEVLSQRHQ